jgi:DivIVA domain-containing protein
MLTITEITNKTFTTTRRREGYDMVEVDQFVEAVAEAITVRDQMIAELQDQVTEARMRTSDGTANRADGLPASGHTPPQSANQDDQARASSVAAARLLEMATVNAEQLLAEARAEADALVTSARAEADQLAAAGRDEAQRTTSELEERKQREAAELDRHRQAVLTEVEDKKLVLEGQVQDLQRIESDHRDRLGRYFTQQLAMLENGGTPTAVPLD